MNSDSLDNKTNEELWQLFPIILEKHNPEWIAFYHSEEQIILNALGKAINRISHIGSSAVPGLLSKPTVDILLELEESSDTSQVKESLLSLGYNFTAQPNNPSPHMMFMKGYTPEGFRGQVVHIHVRYRGDWDEFYFRDFLKEHPETAQEYASLKEDLMKKFRHNRDAYTNEKSEFIKATTVQARELYSAVYR